MSDSTRSLGRRTLGAQLQDEMDEPYDAVRCTWRPPHGLGHYWKTHYADKTFEHLYRWNAFDTALLIPYFIVMVILAFYGIHRYQLVWLYYRNQEERGEVGGAAGALC